MSKPRIIITVEAQGIPSTMIGKTTVAAVIADALRTAFAGKGNTIEVQSLDGDFHQAFTRIKEVTGDGPWELGNLSPEILILDQNGFDYSKGRNVYVNYQVERDRDTNVNSARIVSLCSSTDTDTDDLVAAQEALDGTPSIPGEVVEAKMAARRAQFTGNPDDQQAVRDFLNAHPDREADDGGRLG